MRKVPVEKAVGLALGNDVTRIIPGRRKHRAFRRGHVIIPEDIPRLKELGKEHILVWDADEELVHEDEAARRLAMAAAGPGLECTEPNQGRVNLKAAYDGLLKVQVQQLSAVNNLENVVFSTLHNHRTVAKGQPVAGTRVVPIAIEREILEEAERLCSQSCPLLTVKPFKPLWVATVITGTEVNNGRISEGFGRVIRTKITPFGGRWMGQVIVPDDAGLISLEIQNFIAEGAQLVLVTGGMSVDADDASPRGIRSSGAGVVFYGAPVLPGSQFMLAYQGPVPICGVPGGALFSRRTTLDLLLPRIFSQERITRADIIALGHGGFCEDCRVCHYPICPFGKSSL